MPVPLSSAYANLSNEELLKRLKAVNFTNVGPINDATRSVYLKKLEKLEGEANPGSPESSFIRRSEPSPSRAKPSRRSVGTPKPAVSKSPARRRTINPVPNTTSVPSPSERILRGPTTNVDALDSGPATIASRWTRPKAAEFSDNEEEITGFRRRRILHEPIRITAKKSPYATLLPAFRKYVTLHWNKILFYFVAVVIVVIFIFARRPGPVDSFPVCTIESDPDCIPSDELPDAVKNFQTVKALLEKRALLHDWPQCGNELEAAVASVSRGLTFNEIVKQRYGLLDAEFFVKIRYVSALVKVNPHWGMTLFTRDGSHTDNLGLAEGLEATGSFLPISCLLSFALSALIPRILLLFCAASIVYAGFYGYRYYVAQKQKRDREVYEFIEKALMVLSARKSENPHDPALPVHVVRDKLIKAAMRNDKATMTVWSKVMDFVETQDSRVAVSLRRIGGYDVKVWSFRGSVDSHNNAEIPKHPQDEPMDTSDHREIQADNARLWQGHAFDNNGLKSSPTPCLKIRNMFDPEVETGDDWPLQIHESLLEKCDGIPIVHIAVDKESREGTVYMKCADEEAAGRAYKILHGHWFDGNLVTVKYLMVDRYHQRFPQAQDMRDAIKR
ncbi:unnamed protein product [Notodromas monacha]|uniref:LEM domain-containing protein n=1 Tax=Notodromas monacha TaxID=399045 RepID=A0A7R9GHV6_9CRUS|nr:unnamed protein product [Notodromas monacha]CAG0921916.1 unnamed protein product [Notodromas monacha]